MIIMAVKIGDVIRLEYVLTDEDGMVLDSSEVSNGGPIKIHVGNGQLLRGFEAILIGMEVGEEREVTLLPTEAFGEFDPILLEKIKRNQFPPDKELAIGKQIEYVDTNGMSSRAWIRHVEDDYVIIDMNPPLAGKTVKFTAKLIETGLEPDSVLNPFTIGMSCGGECDHEH